MLNRQQLLNRLAGNLDDFYIFSNPPEEIEVVMHTLLPNPTFVYARADHPLAARRGLKFADVAAEPFLLREPGSGTRIVAEQAFEAHRRKPNVRMELGSNEAIKQAILGGLGVSILSQHTMGPGTQHDGLVAARRRGLPASALVVPGARGGQAAVAHRAGVSRVREPARRAAGSRTRGGRARTRRRIGLSARRRSTPERSVAEKLRAAGRPAAFAPRRSGRIRRSRSPSHPQSQPPSDRLTTDPAARRKGVLLMIAAGLCWSTGGIFVRNVASADGWEIVFWRSVFMVAFLFAVLAWWHRGAVWSRIAAVGTAGVLSGALLAATFFFFILSLMRNTAANTFVLMSTGPFFVAVFGWIFLRERVPLRTWIAIGVALAGITLMFADGLEAGRSHGNLLALGVPTAFALNVVVLRRMHAGVDMVPAVMIAGLISIAVALPLALPLDPNPRDLAVLAPMGFLQLGLGCLLMTKATRYLSAGEVGLLSLIETILAPLWVWIGVGERPTELALVGGVIVFGALAANEWVGFRQGRPVAVPVTPGGA